MFTTISFSESQDPAGVYVNVAATPDNHVNAVGDIIYSPTFNNLIGAAACVGATVPGQPRIVTPSLRRVNPFYISPVEMDLHPDAAFHHMIDPKRAIPLDVNEPIQAEDNSNPAAAEQHAVVVWLADGQVQPVSGKIYTARFQVTLAHVVNSYQSAQIDMIDELPVGDYDVVGASLVSAGGIFFRFVPIGLANRPGALCMNAEEAANTSIFRMGNLGVWFTFNTNNLPSVEVLGSAAVGSATYQGFLDIIKR